MGTVRVDFAGTPSEAADFVKEHGDKFPAGLTRGRGRFGERPPNGDPVVCARFKNGGHLAEVQRTFAKFGWPIEAQELSWFGTKKKK